LFAILIYADQANCSVNPDWEGGWIKTRRKRMPLTVGDPDSYELMTTLCNGKIFLFVVSTSIHRSMLPATDLVRMADGLSASKGNA